MEPGENGLLPRDPGRLFTSAAITEATGETEHERLDEIEVIFGGYEHIDRHALRKCRNLHNFTLINCNLAEIANLQPVGASLVTLRLSNQNITKMSGLSVLPHLRQLYLQQNRISRIEGLGSCRKLQTLWLYDNCLTAVENLDECTDLRELWLQNNKIRSLEASRGGISELVNLQTLQLANNRIRNVDELEHLRKLIALRKLSFLDEHFGSNPIVSHPEYRSLAITTLKQLHQLDGRLVKSAERETAQDQFFTQSMEFNDHIAELTLGYQQELRSLTTRKERGSSNAHMLQQELLEALNDVEVCVTAGQEQIRAEKRRQLQLREQNSQLLKESIGKLQADFNFAIDSALELEERALREEERQCEEMELEALAEQNQALTIATLQNAFQGKIAFQQLLEHSPDYRYIAATFQKPRREQNNAYRGIGSQDVRDVQILQIYRFFHEDLVTAFDASTANQLETPRGLGPAEGSELYLYAVANDDQVISILQHGFAGTPSSITNAENPESMDAWVFLFSNPLAALQFYKGTVGDLESLDGMETDSDHADRGSNTSASPEEDESNSAATVPAVETFNLVLCQVRMQHTIDLFRPENVRLDSLEALHSIASPQGSVLQPPPSAFLQLELGNRDSWSASPSGGHAYMARRALVHTQILPQFLLLCSKRRGLQDDSKLPNETENSRSDGNGNGSSRDDVATSSSESLLMTFQQQLRDEVDEYHRRLYREVDPATVRVRAQFLHEHEQLRKRLEDTECQIRQEKQEQEGVLRAMRGGGRGSGVEHNGSRRA